MPANVPRIPSHDDDYNDDDDDDDDDGGDDDDEDDGGDDDNDDDYDDDDDDDDDDNVPIKMGMRRQILLSIKIRLILMMLLTIMWLVGNNDDKNQFDADRKQFGPAASLY